MRRVRPRTAVEKIEGVKLLAGCVDDFPGQGNDLPDILDQRSLTRDQFLAAKLFADGGGCSSPGNSRVGPGPGLGDHWKRACAAVRRHHVFSVLGWKFPRFRRNTTAWLPGKMQLWNVRRDQARFGGLFRRRRVAPAKMTCRPARRPAGRRRRLATGLPAAANANRACSRLIKKGVPGAESIPVVRRFQINPPRTSCYKVFRLGGENVGVGRGLYGVGPLLGRSRKR